MKHGKPMKVLICNFESMRTPSGVSSYAIKLLRHLPCLEALTTRNAFKTPLEKREVNLDAKSRYNEIIWITPVKFILMCRKIRESDLIHLNPFNFTELILLFIAKINGKKCVATMHSNINSHFLTSVIALEMARLTIVYNVMLLMADRIVFLSRAHYENYRKYSLLKNGFKNKAFIIPNAIEFEKILMERKPAAKSPLTCIFVGRFERRKGIYDLLALAEELQEEEIHFLIVGFGTLQHPEKPLKNVTILGKVNNESLFDYYDKSHIFLMPSYSEAFSITILEAMARGLVVLASDIPGMREKIEAERNGYLFPPGDIEKMKERLLFLKNNPKEISRISRNNLEDVQQFTVEKQAGKYLEVYRNVLSHDQNPL
jgi:glycosyltransferase involved in cell wall biosynthesis